MKPEIKLLPTKDLWPNDGQIPGLPRNPRLIKDEKFAKLVRSIKDDPEMLNLRELLVFPYAEAYVIIAGNMRFRACIEAGLLKVPCKIIPSNTTVDKLKAFVIKDNIGYGDNDWDALANDWDEQQLVDWGMDMPDYSEEEPGDEPMKLDTFRLVIEAENGASLAQARIAIEGIIGDIEGVEIKG